MEVQNSLNCIVLKTKILGLFSKKQSTFGIKIKSNSKVCSSQLIIRFNIILIGRDILVKMKLLKLRKNTVKISKLFKKLLILYNFKEHSRSSILKMVLHSFNFCKKSSISSIFFLNKLLSFLYFQLNK